MRHGDKIKNLSRTKAHRDALLRNLSAQLIIHKRIVTTVAKAKALRVFVEPLITKSKDNTTHQRRIVFSRLQDKAAVKELFDEVAAKVAGRPGGYTRIIKLGIRPGDAAEKALIELVDYNEVYGKSADEKAGTAKRTRRRGGAGKKKAATETVAAQEETTSGESAAEVEVSPEDTVAAAAPVVDESPAKEEETKGEGNEEAKA